MFIIINLNTLYITLLLTNIKKLVYIIIYYMNIYMNIIYIYKLIHIYFTLVIETESIENA